MVNIDDIFRAFGGPTSVGRALGVNPSTASEMRRRGSIPVAYWPKLVEAAKARDVDLTFEDLVQTVINAKDAPADAPARERVSAS